MGPQATLGTHQLENHFSILYNLSHLKALFVFTPQACETTCKSEFFESLVYEQIHGDTGAINTEFLGK